MLKNNIHILLSFIGYGISFIQSLIIIKLLNPNDLGVFISVQVILIYGIQMHFGVLNSLNYYIPYYNINKKYKSKKQLIENSRGIIYIICFIIFILTILVFFNKGLSTNYKYGIISMLLALILSLFFQLNLAIIKSSNRFKEYSQLSLLEALITFILLPVVYYFGLYGAYLRVLLIYILIFLILVIVYKVNINFKLSYRKSLLIIKKGFPIMIIGLIFIIYTNLNKILSIIFLNPIDVGIFSLAQLTGVACLVFPSIVCMYHYNSLIENKNNYDDMYKICIKATLISLSSTIVIGFIIYLIIPLLIVNYYPAYIETIGLINITILTMIFISIGIMPFYLSISSNQLTAYFIITMIVISLLFIYPILIEVYNLNELCYSFLIGVIIHNILNWGNILIYKKLAIIKINNSTVV